MRYKEFKRSILYLTALLLITVLGGCSSTASVNTEEKNIDEPQVVADFNNIDCSIGCLSIVVFDVGQGSTNLVVYPDNTVIMIDAGGSGRNNADAVINWMNHNLPKGKTIDHLVLSHSDNDHTNLLEKLSEGNNPKIVLKRLSSIHLAGRISEYAEKTEAQKFFKRIIANPSAPGGSNNVCTTSYKLVPTISLYCYPPNTFPNSIITPGLPYYNQVSLSTTVVAVNASNPLANHSSIPSADNGDSLVASVRYRSFSALFGGDMEGVTQDAIQSQVHPKFWRNSTLYVVPHHGSMTEGSNAFGYISLVAPEIVAISSAKTQRVGWNHPDGILMRGFLQNNYSGLASQFLNGNPHYILAQYKSNKGSEACGCLTKKSIYTTYTTGLLHIKTNGNQTAWVLGKTNFPQLDPCGNLICGQF